MILDHIFQDKSLKAKAKVSKIGELLISNELNLNELIKFSLDQNAKDKATCIEAIELATKKVPLLANENLLNFITQSLEDNEPRVKWESARVMGNIVKQFPNLLEISIEKLLLNTDNSGTVVRWATAFALAEIIKLKLDLNNNLIPKILIIYEKETDNGVKKKYSDALKKIKYTLKN